MRGKKSDERLLRIRLLSLELDAQREVRREMSTSLYTKAGFVGVGAGLIAGGAFQQVGQSSVWWIWLAPLAVALGTLVACSRAIWPNRFEAVSGRKLTNAWIDSKQSAAELEDFILEIKTRELEFRDEDNEKRVFHLKTSFYLLVASAILVVVAAFAAGLVDHHGQPSPTPTPTPEVTESARCGGHVQDAD